MPTLQQLGWAAFFEQQIDAAARLEFQVARVTEEQRGRYALANETEEVSADVSGRLRHAATGRADFPAVGDWVLY